MKYIITDKPYRIVAVDLPEDYEVLEPWIELNEEQAAFYLDNLSASPNEVLDMQLKSIDFNLYKSMRILDIERLSLQTSETRIPAYKRENASLSIALLNDGYSDTIYGRSQSEEILQQFNKISIACRNERYRIIALIEQAETIEEIDNIVSSNKFSEL